MDEKTIFSAKNISGKNIRKLRERQQPALSIYDLATAVESEGLPLTPLKLFEIECGQAVVPDLYLPIFAKLLDVSLPDLLR